MKKIRKVTLKSQNNSAISLKIETDMILKSFKSRSNFSDVGFDFMVEKLKLKLKSNYSHLDGLNCILTVIILFI